MSLPRLFSCLTIASIALAVPGLVGRQSPAVHAATPKASPKASPKAAPKATPDGDTALHADWKLIWEDDFSKDKQIDKTKWNFEIDGKGNGNGELEYYTDSPKNAHLESGELVITALKDDGGHKFTSARMNTKGKFSCLYGRIESSIKVPKAQQGNWPAFWMMPQDNKYGGWPKSGEIDIMEFVNKSDKLYGTLHFAGEKGDIHHGAQTTLPGGDFTKDYHVYAAEWEAKEIRWYLDGKYYGKLNDWHSANAPFPAPFDQKFYVILNFAVGGAWPKSPDASSTFPQSMNVKYVRVYQPPQK
jgi:beta-glucanase (GH16 family)